MEIESEGLSEQLRLALAAPGGQWQNRALKVEQGAVSSCWRAALERLAESDASVEVRFRAKKLLSDLRNDADRDPAGKGRDREAHAQNEENGPPAGRAVELGGLRKALAAVKRPPASAALPSEDVSQADGMIAADGQVREARLAILRTFAATHRAQGAEEILATLSSEGDPVVLAAGLGLVGLHGMRHQVGALRRFLASESPRVVASAVEAAGRLDADAALPMILSLLTKDDNRVRANVLMVLYQTRRPEVLAYLAQMSAKFDESYRASALWLLGQLQGEDIEEILASMICREQVPELFEKELALITRVGTKRCISLLSQCGAENPLYRNAVQKAVDQVASRLGVDSREREALETPVGPRGAESFGQKLRRLTRGIRLPAGLRTAPSLPPPPSAGSRPGAWGEPSSRDAPDGNAKPAAGTGLAVAALAIVGIGFATLFTRGTHATDPRTVAGAERVAGGRSGVARTQTESVLPHPPVAGKVGLVDIKGQVGTHFGAGLTMVSDYQRYAITYTDPATTHDVKAGDTVHVKGTFAGWDTLHDVVHLHGTALEMMQ